MQILRTRVDERLVTNTKDLSKVSILDKFYISKSIQ